MKRRSIALLATVAILAVAPDSLSAADQANERAASGIAWLIIIAPPVLFFAIIYLFVRRSASKQGNYMERAAQHIDLAEEHMARLERKTDRMIELLESIDRKLDEES